MMHDDLNTRGVAGREDGGVGRVTVLNIVHFNAVTTSSSGTQNTWTGSSELLWSQPGAPEQFGAQPVEASVEGGDWLL